MNNPRAGVVISSPNGVTRFCSGICLLCHRAWVLLIGHHEDEDLRVLILARIARGRMQGAGRFVKDVAGFEEARRLAVDGELVSTLEHVTKGVVAGMPVRRACGTRRAVKERDADLASREV